MNTLRIIAALMDFPTAELVAHQRDLLKAIELDSNLSTSHQERLSQFVNTRCDSELFDWQADYDGLFERGRSLSLFVFEHTHGESRDRGQAMVDLLARYREAGLELSERELPDYLPVYLEFASTQGDENAIAWVQDIGPVIAVLATRLEQRNCNYAALYFALLDIAKIDFDQSSLTQQVASEERDDTPEKLDEVWEEEMVTFGAATDQSDCASGIQRPSPSQRKDHEQPLNFVDAGR